MQWFKQKNSNKLLAANLFKTKIADGISSVADFRRIIGSERARADRANYHFSLILLDLKFSNDNHKTNKILLQKIISRARKIDQLGWYDKQRIGILLPYTSEQGAQKFAENLCELFEPPTAQCVFKLYTYGLDKTEKISSPSDEISEKEISKGRQGH
jgi:PleD family two-component response regulator